MAFYASNQTEKGTQSFHWRWRSKCFIHGGQSTREFRRIGTDQLLLLACAEINGANTVVVVLFAVCILLGRIFHAYAFLPGKNHFKPRAMGMKITLYTLLALGLFNMGLLVVYG